MKAMSQNTYVAVFFAVITIWVLISDDLRLACMPPSADAPMAAIAVICMVAFVFEIVMYSIGTKSYLFSFFFWLDVLATASMILDIPLVRNAILGTDGNSESLDNTTLARATRMSRIGTKAGRITSVRLPSHVCGDARACTSGCLRPFRHRADTCTNARIQLVGKAVEY